MDWLQLAAGQNQQDAIELLGEIKLGMGTRFSKEAILDVLERRSATDSKALECLSMMYFGRWGVESDAKAIEYLQRMVDTGNAWANTPLALVYINNDGELKDVDRGLKILDDMASADDGSAMCMLGQIYYEGEIVSRDISKAICWLKKAADKGIDYAYYVLGYISSEYGHDTDAASWFLKGAAHREMNCMDYISECYRYGKGIGLSDSEADRWCWEFAEEDRMLFYCDECREREARNRC